MLSVINNGFKIQFFKLLTPDSASINYNFPISFTNFYCIVGTADMSYKGAEYGFVIIDKDLSTLSKVILATATGQHGWFSSYVYGIAIGF